jgi:hypothetical protein
VAERRARKTAAPAEPAAQVPDANASAGTSAPFDTREALAKAARLSSNQVVLIEKIQKQAAPELVAAVKAGTISINAAAAVASLPAEEQVAAAAAGKDELKQAAKRAREAKRKPRSESAEATQEDSEPKATVESLQQRVAALTAENEVLRRQVAGLEELLQARESSAEQAADASSPF